MQKLDHVECFLDVWYFIFEALSALCQICVHVAIFPVLLSIQECHAIVQQRNERDRVLETLEGSLDVTVRTADVFLDIDLESRLMASMSPRDQCPLTINGAFGIPRGFFSSPNIDAEAITLLGVHLGLDLAKVTARHFPIGVGETIIFCCTFALDGHVPSHREESPFQSNPRTSAKTL